jgi:uncharacterized protein YndB with AHSA1/START domain
MDHGLWTIDNFLYLAFLILLTMRVNFKDSISLPAAQIFDAIVDHVKMTKYFISAADSSIVEGRKIMWEWADENASMEIHVKKVEKNKCIRFEWEATGNITIAEINLKPDGDKTIIHITEGEWSNDEAGGMKAMQQTQGWTDFFDCLKAYLLFNVNLRTGERL